MKKSLLTLSLALPLFIGAQAQVNGYQQRASQVKLSPATEGVISSGNHTTNNANRAVLFQSDFSTASNWTLGAAVGSQGAWVIGTPPQQVTDYVGAVTALTAPVAYYNSVQFHLNNTVATALQDAWIQATDTIDVTAYNFIRVAFKQVYRPFNTDQVLVEVANAATGTWISKEVNADVPTNLGTNNIGQQTAFANFDVTGIDSIVVRFRFKAEAVAGTGGGYGWVVDDVQVTDCPENDVRLFNPYVGLYSQYPLGQETRDIEMFVGLNNEGFGAQSITSEALSGAQSLGTVSAQALPAFSRDSAEFTTFFTPAAGLGTKTVTFEAEYATGTETITPVNKAFQVTANTFAKDNSQYFRGFDYAGIQVTGGLSITNVMSAFIVSETAKITSVSVALGTNTTAGSSFKVSLFRVVDGELELMVESDFIDVTAALINGTAPTTNPKFVKVGFFNTAYEVEPGEYWVSVDNAGGDIGVVYDPINVAATLPDGTPSLLFSTDDGEELFRLIDANIPFIRLNLNEAGVSVNESELATLSVYPNPTSDVLNIAFGEVNGDAKVELFSTEGKLVFAKNLVAVKNQTSTIDVNGLAAGIYNVKITSSNASTTQKVMIK